MPNWRTSLTVEEYKKAQQLFATTWVLQDNLDNVIIGTDGLEAGFKSGIWFTKRIEIPDSKKPQDGVDIVWTYATFSVDLETGTIIANEDVNIEQVLADPGLSDGSNTAFQATMDNMDTPNVEVVDHGQLTGTNDPNMTLMGTPERPMVIVQWDYTYTVVMVEEGKYTVTRRKWNILQAYRMQRQKIKHKLWAYFKYEVSTQVNIDIKQVLSVWAKFKNGTLSWSLNNEYIRQLDNNFLNAIGVAQNLDTRNGLSVFFKTYVPGAELSFGENEFVSIDFNKVKLWNWKVWASILWLDWEITAGMKIETNPIEAKTDKEVAVMYREEFKRLLDDKATIDAVIQSARDGGVEINDENINELTVKIINSMIIQNFETQRLNFNPRINLSFSKENREFVFHSLKSLIENIAGILSIEIASIKWGFHSVGLPYSTEFVEQDVKDYMSTSIWKDIHTIKGEMAPLVGINPKLIRVYVAKWEELTELDDTSKMLIPEWYTVSKIVNKSSQDLNYADVAYHLEKDDNTQVSHEEVQEDAPDFNGLDTGVSYEFRSRFEWLSSRAAFADWIYTRSEAKIEELLDRISKGYPKYMSFISDKLQDDYPNDEHALNMAIMGQMYVESEKNMKKRNAESMKEASTSAETFKTYLLDKVELAEDHVWDFHDSEKSSHLLDQYKTDIETLGVRVSSFKAEEDMIVQIHAQDEHGNESIQTHIMPEWKTETMFNMIRTDEVIVWWKDVCGNYMEIRPFNTSKKPETKKQVKDIPVQNISHEYTSLTRFWETAKKFNLGIKLEAPVYKKIAKWELIYQETWVDLIEEWQYIIQSDPITVTLEGGHQVEITHVPRPSNVNNGMSDDEIYTAVTNYLGWHGRISQAIRDQLNAGGYYTNEDIKNAVDHATAEASADLESKVSEYEAWLLDQLGYSDKYELYARWDEVAISTYNDARDFSFSDDLLSDDELASISTLEISEIDTGIKLKNNKKEKKSVQELISNLF